MFVDAKDAFLLRSDTKIKIQHHRNKKRIIGFEVIKESNTKFGSKGTFGWGGMFGTYFRIDPVENMIFIYMTQSFETYKLKLSNTYRELVYKSLSN